MTKPTDFITIGKIGSTFGVSGWLKIIAYTEFGANILEYQPWYLSSDDNEPLAVEVEDSRLQGKYVLAKFKGIESPEAAAKLTGQTLSIPRSQLPTLKKDEYYWTDLVGLNVITKEGKNLGKVIYLMETGSNDVLVVKGEKETAIPFIHGTVILNIDLANAEILVDWEPI